MSVAEKLNMHALNDMKLDVTHAFKSNRYIVFMVHKSGSYHRITGIRGSGVLAVSNDGKTYGFGWTTFDDWITVTS